MSTKRRGRPSRFRRMVDDSHLGYTLITALERFLDTFSPPFVVVFGLLMMALRAGAAAVAWGGVEIAQHVTAWADGVTYWNFLTRFYVYEAIVILVAPMRDAVIWEREVALREVEAADKLRALNELRAAMGAEEQAKLDQLQAMVELRRVNTQAEIAVMTF